MLAVVRRWYRIVLVLVVGLAVVLVARRLRGDRTVVAPPTQPPAPRTEPTPTLTVEPMPDPEPTPTAEPAPDPPPARVDPEAAPAAPDAWVTPTDGACPASHPVKAKEASGIFHVEGGLSYERTRADRCYLSAEAAEADGYRAAKR